MNEIEVKIFEIDKNYLISKLEELWAIKIFEWDIVNDFFINSDKKKIRLRKKWNKNLMTYKERIENEKAVHNMEHELAFEDYETMKNILVGIWFDKYWESNKYRISYRFENIEFDFDSYPWIPDFVEIEAKSNEELVIWVELIWYKMRDTKTLTERQVKEFYWII